MPVRGGLVWGKQSEVKCFNRICICSESWPVRRFAEITGISCRDDLEHQQLKGKQEVRVVIKAILSLEQIRYA